MIPLVFPVSLTVTTLFVLVVRPTPLHRIPGSLVVAMLFLAGTSLLRDIARGESLLTDGAGLVLAAGAIVAMYMYHADRIDGIIASLFAWLGLEIGGLVELGAPPSLALYREDLTILVIPAMILADLVLRHRRRSGRFSKTGKPEREFRK